MISVIIPVYDERPFLAGCVGALRAQSHRGEMEIVVVDDGSKDDSAAVAESLGARVVRQANQGPGAARNAGARAAAGDPILFIDADCVADRDWVKEMLACFGEPDVVAAQGAYATKQDGRVARCVQLEFEERYRKLGARPTVDFFASHSVGFRRDYFLEIGGFRPDLMMNEDVELAYRIWRRGGKMIFNPAARVFHSHPDSLSSYFVTKFWRGYWRSVVYRAYPRKAFSDTYTPQTLKLQVLLVYVAAAALVSAPFHTAGLTVAASAAGLSTLSMAVFLREAWKEGAGVGITSLGFLWARALALAAGAAAGLARREGARAFNWRRARPA